MYLIGLPIGFYGYLLPGNINILVMHLYGSKKFNYLFVIMALIIIFESAYCFISLFYLSKIGADSQLYAIIELFSYLFVFVMGLWMVFENKSGIKVIKSNTFNRGLLNIVIHPQQIPFWIIMGVTIQPFFNPMTHWNSIAGFLFFNAAGTCLVMTFYMVYGNRLIHYFQLQLRQLNAAIGFMYLVVAVVSLLAKIKLL